ncbi:hypothetical protein [Nocardioides aurantiacus]|uniref:Uncharacterized protein n=1 Tax=Nocardioides aurantiacus TaxID=86796 RepID=A0A3N2CP79_9ACTN|nr:hypothetical protein [Nocardioides aurantiacus]ROR89331.1 hypothetical protein EDD33_0151 [Nocardioides aurantiacus]
MGREHSDHDHDHDPDAAVRKAGARVGGLSTWGRTPSPEERADALRRLAVARIDREIREQRAKSPSPDPTEIGYLVGLLLMWGQSDPEAVERLERAIREAVYCTPSVTAEDRARLAAILRSGGER